MLTEQLKSHFLSNVEKVRRWGDITTDAILDPACKIFNLDNFDGLIGYRIESGYAVVFGDPVCAPTEKVQFAKAFQKYCQGIGLGVIYVSVSEEFARDAINNICHISIEFGEKLFIDPHNNPKNNTGVKGSLVRRKVRHAQHENTFVKEYISQDQKLEAAMEQVGDIWLKSRSGPQIHISHVRLFENRKGKRWFYAMKGDKMVGVVLLNELKAREGWLLNHLMITPDAPHGTPELLVTSALEALEKEGCHYVTFGAVPARRLGGIIGLKSISAVFAHGIYNMAKWIFHLEGHGMFWEKFQPQSEPAYILFDQKRIHLGAVRALMNGLNVSL